jgi:hypothetical protein
MADEDDLINKLADGLRQDHPCDRETEQERYRSTLLLDCACAWKDAAALEKGVPIFGRSEGGERVLVYDDAKGAQLVADAHAGDVDADAALCVAAGVHPSRFAAEPSFLR